MNIPTNNLPSLQAKPGSVGSEIERTPSFWRATVSGDWKGVESELRNFGDAYATRRIREADLLAAMDNNG